MGVALGWTPPAGMSEENIAGWRGFYYGIRQNYGLSPADYRLLYVAQKGRCAICRKARGIHPDDPKAAGSRRLGVDHNHALGNGLEAVRGLLCSGGPSTCNRIIGWLDRAALQRAADYLAAPPAPEVLGRVRAQLESADRAGARLEQAEIDAWALAALWGKP